MDNNMSLNRIHVSPQLTLIIKDFSLNDSGIYRCHGKQKEEMDQKFNYRLEAVYEFESTESLPRGNLSDWQKYQETYLIPVTMRFAVSKMKEISLIRKAGITMELISEWGPWSPCENCKFGKGYKIRQGFFFLRHLMYLGFILLLTSFCYCSGLVAAFQRRHKFESPNYEELKNREREKKPFFEAVE
ncbi:uncharacterized protein LOC122508519 [Leptopilina heterotoma]|uniref:uncharacterized protein LOC122508519 n=1 Tax=Leptopilina heterotoma TaxID=63436 RepID=UPI001CA88A24|nr:uncharacterized protein LOC122508519 [Leptopilina heterotoma]